MAVGDGAAVVNGFEGETLPTSLTVGGKFSQTMNVIGSHLIENRKLPQISSKTGIEFEPKVHRT